MQRCYECDEFSNRQACPVTGKLYVTCTNAAFRKHNRVLDKGKDIPCSKFGLLQLFTRYVAAAPRMIFLARVLSLVRTISSLRIAHHDWPKSILGKGAKPCTYHITTRVKRDRRSISNAQWWNNKRKSELQTKAKCICAIIALAAIVLAATGIILACTIGPI